MGVARRAVLANMLHASPPVQQAVLRLEGVPLLLAQCQVRPPAAPVGAAAVATARRSGMTRRNCCRLTTRAPGCGSGRCGACATCAAAARQRRPLYRNCSPRRLCRRRSCSSSACASSSTAQPGASACRRTAVLVQQHRAASPAGRWSACSCIPQFAERGTGTRRSSDGGVCTARVHIQHAGAPAVGASESVTLTKPRMLQSLLKTWTWCTRQRGEIDTRCLGLS